MKLHTRNENFLGHNFTITTKNCFKNARIEVRAKGPRVKNVYIGLYMQAYERGCQDGNVKERYDIAEIGGDSDQYTTGLLIHQGKSHSVKHNRLDKQDKFSGFSMT